MKKGLCVLIVMLCIAALGVYAGGSQEQQASKATTKIQEVNFPLEETLELNFMLQTRLHDDLNELAYLQKIEQETNVKINWEIVQSGWDEKRSLMFASNDLPDGFFGAKALNSIDLLNNASFFTPLEDYIETYAPNIKNMFEIDPAMKGYVTATDNHIYAVPQRMPLRPKTRAMMYINQNWLDNLGLDLPTTTEEYFQVLKAFKEQDPNGNGKADEIPLIFNQLKNVNSISILFGAFGLADNTTGDWIHLEDGKLSYMFADERAKEAIRYFNRMYAAGLFSSENFTMQWGQIVALNRNPEVSIVGSGFHWTIGAAMNNAEREEEYTALPPLIGPNGDQLWRPSTIMTVNNAAFAMPKKNPAKEITMAWVDQFYNPEIGIELYFGPVGTSLDKDENGVYTVLPSQDPNLTQSAWSWAHGMNDLTPAYFSEAFEKRIVLGYPDTKMDYDKIYAPYAEKVDEFPPFLNYTREEIEDLSVMKADINSFATEKISQWIMNGNIDKEWDAYQKQLKAMGLDRMMAIYDAAYRRYLAP